MKQVKRTTLELPETFRQKACRIAIEVTGKPSIVGGIMIALKKYRLKDGK